jgi:hypothetical protein
MVFASVATEFLTYYTNMDFLAVEYDVIRTEKINIDRGDSRGQY